MTVAPRSAVFLDRDGVLNALVVRDDRAVSPREMRDFRLFEEVPDAVQRLRDCGLLVFVVTNQPDLARGMISDDELARMTAALQSAIAADEVVVCGHDDDAACGCRKPAPGMVLDLAARWQIDLPHSFVIGDSWRDVEAGRRAGCRTILLDRTGGADAGADLTFHTLCDAVAHITTELGRERMT